MKTSPGAGRSRLSPGADVPAEEPDQSGWEEQFTVIYVHHLRRDRIMMAALRGYK